MPDTAAGIPYEDTDCTADEAVEAVKAVRTTAALTARCPVCHRRQRVLCLGSPGHRFAIHQSGSRQCSGSGTVAP